MAGQDQYENLVALEDQLGTAIDNIPAADLPDHSPDLERAQELLLHVLRILADLAPL